MLIRARSTRLPLRLDWQRRKTPSHHPASDDATTHLKLLLKQRGARALKLPLPKRDLQGLDLWAPAWSFETRTATPLPTARSP